MGIMQDLKSENAFYDEEKKLAHAKNEALFLRANSDFNYNWLYFKNFLKELIFPFTHL